MTSNHITEPSELSMEYFLDKSIRFWKRPFLITYGLSPSFRCELPFIRQKLTHGYIIPRNVSLVDMVPIRPISQEDRIRAKHDWLHRSWQPHWLLWNTSHYAGEGFRKDEVEWTREAKIRKAEFLAAGEAFKTTTTTLYSFGFSQGDGALMSVSTLRGRWCCVAFGCRELWPQKLNTMWWEHRA